MLAQRMRRKQKWKYVNIQQLVSQHTLIALAVNEENQPVLSRTSIGNDSIDIATGVRVAGVLRAAPRPPTIRTADPSFLDRITGLGTPACL
ncbi:hypothetical protein EVAR_62314_1 [Eumeta japonica]|uniref:Uncharacterized protein n=1 Tax=Eumeta variegata TaxID=151549 RepID=A0A4C1ZES4_EUMVA|nr:hypothetical protein EVAR_62314_1 [Eumeta japonica]